jgi:hypothetical protein
MSSQIFISCTSRTYQFTKYEGHLRSSWTQLITPSRTLWWCGDGLFFEVLPLVSVALLTTLNPLLENVLLTVDHFEISCLGAPFSWLEKPRSRMGRDGDCMADVLMGFHRSTFSKPNTEFNSDLASCEEFKIVCQKFHLQNVYKMK